MSHSIEDQGAGPLIQPVVEPFQKFIHAETAGGILLLGATIAAMTIPARTRLTGPQFIEKGKALLKLFEEVVSQDEPLLANPERSRVARRMKTAVAHVGTPLQQLKMRSIHG